MMQYVGKLMQYVGKTERNLKNRLTEHFRQFKKENSLAEHLNLNNHSFSDGSGIKLIKVKLDPKLISAIESLEILKLSKKNHQVIYKECVQNCKEIQIFSSPFLK